MILLSKFNGYYFSFLINRDFFYIFFCLKKIFSVNFYFLFFLFRSFSYFIDLCFNIIIISNILNYFSNILNLRYCVFLSNYHFLDYSDSTSSFKKYNLYVPFFIILSSNKKIMFFLCTIKKLISLIKLLKLIYIINIYSYFFYSYFYLLKKNYSSLPYLNNFFLLKSKIISGSLIQCQLGKSNLIKTNIDSFFLFLLCFRFDFCSCFYISTLRIVFLSFTPEILFTLSSSNLFLFPIAGTIYRGKNIYIDKYFEKNLLNNSKELSEHLMLIDLSRNDLNYFSFPSSVKIFTSFSIKKFFYVQHIVTLIQSKISSKFSFNKVLEYISPVGTITGAPKYVSLHFISLYEKPRLFYGGSFGIFNYFSNFYIFFVLIRTLFISKGYCFIRSSSGIVLNSFLLNEYFELNNKLKVFLKR